VSARELEGLGLREASTRPPTAEGGFNIEGLAPTPDGHLLVGFRNPLPRGRDIVGRVENPAELIARSSARARVTWAGLLDLGGRGIRALEFVPIARTYLIIAGSSDGRDDLRVYTWSGAPADAPEPLDIPGFDDLRPEELIVVPSDDRRFEVEFFSDDGERLVDGRRC
jgi:hypothetical protein